MANFIDFYDENEGDSEYPSEFCPNGCVTRLSYFTGGSTLPDDLYCSTCHDVLYDFDGNEIATLRHYYETI